MPTNFLSEDQRQRFGRFAQDPDEGQLAGSFLLDQTARRRAMAAKGARNRIGWAVQLGTVRYLGTFLDNPEHVPAVVVDYGPGEAATEGQMKAGGKREGNGGGAAAYLSLRPDSEAVSTPAVHSTRARSPPSG